MLGIRKPGPFFAAPVVLLTWIALIPRILPDRSSDRGIFVSTAERLLAGDTLYSGVFDNKEPLFYYFVVIQRALGWGAELAAEFLLILLAAAAIYAMAIKVTTRWVAIVISLLAVPITLTGGYYDPGYSELFGTVLVLVAIAAAFNERPLLAGVSIGLLLFAKMIDMPVAIVGVGCVLLSLRRLSDTIPIFLAACASALCVIGILAVRGEFWPFIETIRLNVAYSQGELIGGRTGIAALAEHLRRAGGKEIFGQTVLLILVDVVAVLLLFFRRRTPQSFAIVLISAGVLLASVGVLAITGLWVHHAQILYVPALIGLMGLTQLFDHSETEIGVLAVLAIMLCASVLGGSLSLYRYFRSIRDFRSSLVQMWSLSPEAQRLLATGSTGAYARLGQNDDLGHAIGLQGWRLACPRFHQYSYTPKELLDDVRECASKAPVLILAESLKTGVDASSQWNEFVGEIESLVSSYRCDAGTGLRVCRRVP